MAISSVQGFVKSSNLKENELDRQAINNLGTAPIADDLSLFINNLKNESRIQVKSAEFDRIEGLVKIVNTTAEESRLRSAVFTNGDPVRIEDLSGNIIRSNLYVANSDGEFNFGFATDPEGLFSFNFSPSADFVVIRNDAVTLENISNLGVLQTTASLSTGLGDGTGDTADGAAVDLTDTYANQFDEIYEYLDIAKYQAESKFVNDQDVAADVDFAMEGTFTIQDPSDTILATGITPNSPGLYISNPTSPVSNIQRIRAFSDTFNPWEDTGTALSTLSEDVTAGDLKLNQGLTIQGITALTESGNVDSNTFSHKVKINVDGIDYYLCLTLDT